MPRDPDIIRWFSYKHLPDGKLQEVSKTFCDLAHQVCDELPPCEERQEALRKLLEAKDCAVRAKLWETGAAPQTKTG